MYPFTFYQRSFTRRSDIRHTWSFDCICHRCKVNKGSVYFALIYFFHIHFACRTRQSLVPLCLLLTAKSASRFISSAFCAKENIRVFKQEHNQSLFKGTPTSFPSTLWTTAASGDVMDALIQVMIAQRPTSCDFKQARRTNAQTQSFRVQ